VTAESASGTSSRQRRAAEQSARIVAARRAQIRQRTAFAGGLAFIVLLLIGAGVLLVPRPTAAQGHQVPIEGNRQHNAQGASIAYHNRPPSSGDHYDQPSGYGVFARDMPLGNLVHTLEHGGVVVYHRPDLCDQSCMGLLQQAYNSAPRSQRYGVVKMVVAPWLDMDQAVTAAAWGWIDGMDQPDVQRTVAFYRDHVDRGPEDALQIMMTSEER
jgi:hypothetical protein